MTGKALRLIANLGAEEGAAGMAAAMRRGGDAETLAVLWRGLFNPPAFPWLGGIEAAAWLNDEVAERGAGTHKLSGASAAIVRRVHDKAWAVLVAREEKLEPRVLRGLATPLSPEELRASGTAALVADVLAGWPPWARARVTLKPRLGTSGRGRVAGVDGLVNDAMRGAFERLAAHGGGVLEPWLDRVVDASAQLHVAKDGVVTQLGTLRMVTTVSGQPKGHRGRFDFEGRVSSGVSEEEALRKAAHIAGVHAVRAGYWGPGGIDAFAFRSPEDGARRFRPLVEFNARFTAGTVALGYIARNLDRVKSELDLASDETCHFYFGRRSRGMVFGPREGTVVVPLFRESEQVVNAPVLIVARDEAVIDAWLRCPEMPE